MATRKKILIKFVDVYHTLNFFHAQFQLQSLKIDWVMIYVTFGEILLKLLWPLKICYVKSTKGLLCECIITK